MTVTNREFVLTRSVLSEHFEREFERCWTFWREQGVAIAGYNTSECAEDLEDLRRHVGVKKLNLLGASYGSHLAMATLKNFPASIDRVALASLEGLDQTVKRPARVDELFICVDEMLKKDARTRTAVPDFLGMARRVHARLEAEPARVKLAIGSHPTTVVIGTMIVQMIAGELIKNPDSLAQLPMFYLQLDAGNFEGPARQLYERSNGFERPMAGMPEVGSHRLRRFHVRPLVPET